MNFSDSIVVRKSLHFTVSLAQGPKNSHFTVGEPDHHWRRSHWRPTGAGSRLGMAQHTVRSLLGVLGGVWAPPAPSSFTGSRVAAAPFESRLEAIPPPGYWDVFRLTFFLGTVTSLSKTQVFVWSPTPWPQTWTLGYSSGSFLDPAS